MFVNIYKPEGMLIGTEENREFLSSQTGIERAAAAEKYLRELQLCAMGT